MHIKFSLIIFSIITGQQINSTHMKGATINGANSRSCDANGLNSLHTGFVKYLKYAIGKRNNSSVWCIKWPTGGALLSKLWSVYISGPDVGP